MTSTKTLKDNPEYFGAYLNMARHNMFMLINHLTDKFQRLNPKYQKITDDENIKDFNILTDIFSNRTISYEQKWSVFNYINNRHFLPILKYFKFRLENVDYEDFENQEMFFERIANFLKIAFKEIDCFRNSYTHYLIINDEGRVLNRKIDINSSIKEEVAEMFKLAPKFSYFRNSETLKVENYEHLELYKIFENETNTLTDQGFYFFICLFLEKKYAYKFLKRFSGFKNENFPSFRATLKSFSSYTITAPIERIKNEHPRHSLVLEILNELNKCPLELYRHLTVKDKELFEPKLNEGSFDQIALNSTNYEEISEEALEKAIKDLIPLKRHEDRFTYFALKFIDELDIFKNIRFQITLGKIKLNQYPKTIINETDNRSLLKTINAFGKLSSFFEEEYCIQNVKSQTFENLVFEQFAPHYNISNNKIGFYIFNDNEPKEKFPLLNKAANEHQPSGFISIHDLPKLVTLAILCKGELVEKMLVDFVNTTNKTLLDKSVIDDIKSKLSFDPETFTTRIMVGKNPNISKKALEKLDEKKRNMILLEYEKRKEYKDFMKTRRKSLSDALKNYNLKTNQFPIKVVDYLWNKTKPNADKSFKYSIKRIVAEINDLKKKLKKDLKDKRKIKLGELATFLTLDIIDMVVSLEIKQKITSPYSRKLQNKIAFFSTNKTEIVELLQELNLFDINKGHVFITKELITQSEDIIDFYERYLEAKLSWIEETFNKNKKGYAMNLTTTIPYSIKKLESNANDSDLEQYLINKSKLPVDLPNSLFDEELNKKLSYELKREDITNSNNLSGFSNLLKLYHKCDTQPYYSYKRVYKSKGEFEEIDVNEQDNQRLKRRYGKQVEENEKVIRFYQTKDRVLKMMGNYIIIKEQLITDKSSAFSKSSNVIILENINPYSKLNPLDSPVKISKNSGISEIRIIGEDNLELVNTGSLGYKWTMKDYGRFNRIFKDRRLIEFFKNHVNSKEICYELVEYEFNEYDNYREKIFKLVFELEKRIAENYKDKLIEKHLQKTTKYNEIQFDVYYELITEKIGKQNFKSDLILKVRNKFSHSEFFPILKDFQTNKITVAINNDFHKNHHLAGYKGEVYFSLSKQVFEAYEKETVHILNELKKNDPNFEF